MHRSARSLSALGLAALFVACDGVTVEVNTPGTDAPADTTPLSEVPTEWAALDPTADDDGDGLSNQEEVEGYEITVNATGWPGEVVTTRVFSDPTQADADQDGLDDAAERTARTHPLFADTDGDGLGDEEEVRFWGTSPTDVDTDGDAVGTDGLLRPPNPALFDGGELALDRSVTEADGRPVPGRPGPFATSPRLADTDGDTVDDHVETLGSGRSPVIAEVVDVQLIPTPSSEVEIGLVGSTTDGTATTSTFSESIRFDEGMTSTLSTEMSTTLTSTIDTWYYANVDVSLGCCADIFSEEAEAGFGIDTSMHLDQGFSMGFSSELSFDMQDTSAEANTIASNSAFELTGGIMRLSVDLTNSGAVATKVADMALIARVVDGETGALEVLGELVPVASQAQVFLAPGESTTIQVENLDLPLEVTQELLEDPRSVSIHIARYDLRNADDEDFDFVYADLPARTATVSVEREGVVDHFYMAADVFTDVEGHRYGTTLAHALTARGHRYGLDPNADGQLAVSIDGIASELHTTEPPDLQEGGADPYGYPVTGGPGERALRKGWVGLRFTDDEDERDVYYTDFFEAKLRPSDGITLLLSEDLDQDGVPALEEALHGSSDLTVHSDAGPNDLGDGLSDFFEIREGWVVEPSEVLPYRAYSSPGSIDTDGDGLLDHEETSFDGTGTDPAKADTDGDGYSDDLEVTDPWGVHDPLFTDPFTAPTLVCSYVQSETCIRTYTLSVLDEAGDVRAIELSPGDGTTPFEVAVQPSPGEVLDEEVVVDHCWLGHGSLDGGTATVVDDMATAFQAPCVREVR